MYCEPKIWIGDPKHLNTFILFVPFHALVCFLGFWAVLRGFASFWVVLHAFAWLPVLLCCFMCFCTVLCVFARFCVLLCGFTRFCPVLQGFKRLLHAFMQFCGHRNFFSMTIFPIDTFRIDKLPRQGYSQTKFPIHHFSDWPFFLQAMLT
jgi:hypothetical protein